MPMPRISWGQHPDIQMDPNMKAWAEGLTYAVFDPSMQEFDPEVTVAISDLLSTAWQKAIYAGASPKEALTEGAQEADKILAKAKST